MSYTDKIAQATKLIAEHNSLIEDPKDHVKIDEFQSRLKKLGGSTESALKESTWEDLVNCGVPIILARKIASIFRTTETTQLGDGDYINEKKAAKMSPLYLLQRYEIGDTESHVAKRLITLSQGKRFLVVDANGKINAEASFKILEEIKKGYGDRESVLIDGLPVKPICIGDKKLEMVDENPIWPGRPLRPDGTCDQLNRSWSGVSLVIRQIVYLAVRDTKEIVATAAAGQDVLDKALASDEKAFRQRYAKASIRLDDLTAEGKAPSLKIALSKKSKKDDEEKEDPFHGHRTW